MKLSDQDIYDISEYVVWKIEDYIDDFEKFGTYLTLDDFIKERLVIDLKLKYNRYQIEEAFEDYRLITIMAFYMEEPTEDDTLH
jgi:hypothetical protein